MGSTNGQATDQVKQTLRSLESDAAKMVAEVGELSARLKDIGKQKLGELSDESVAQMQAQLQVLQSRLKNLSSDSQKLMEQVDKSVRSNPYLYILGALGLGLLLGKARRS